MAEDELSEDALCQNQLPLIRPPSVLIHGAFADAIELDRRDHAVAERLALVAV